jgi:hypothetical protein
MQTALTLLCCLFYSVCLSILEPESELLYLDNESLCPANEKYGAVIDSFYVSPIFSFGKKWQLRSVLIDNSTWRIIPFFINSGGGEWNLPFISDAVTTVCAFIAV